MSTNNDLSTDEWQLHPIASAFFSRLAESDPDDEAVDVAKILHEVAIHDR